MSAREPLWYCHECHAEMRPLMVPDPVCASCHGSFVEKMENAADDPRQFAAGEPDLFDVGMGGMGDASLGPAALLFSLQSLMDRGMRDRAGGDGTGSSFRVELRGPSGSRTMHFGRGAGNAGTNGSPGRNNNEVPNMSTFLGTNPFGIPVPLPTPGGGGDRPNISGPLMANYLMALLGHTEPGMFGAPENGRMGDYVFNQEALDQIISQIMENSNAHRPVPAPEEVISKLPREVLMEGSPMLERDCAVCKDQFKLDTEDPDEQIVVTLPCKHPFHQPCITPWLTSSGTCPVCRFALVPQPDQHPAPNPGQSPAPAADSRPSPTQSSSNSNNNTSNNSNNSSTNSGSSSGRGPDGGANRNGGSGQAGPGFIQSIFSNLMGLAHPPPSHETASEGDNSNSNNRTGASSYSNSRDNSVSENAGQRGTSSRGYPSSPPRDQPRSPPAPQSPGSGAGSDPASSPSSPPRWRPGYAPSYRRPPPQSPSPYPYGSTNSSTSTSTSTSTSSARGLPSSPPYTSSSFGMRMMRPGSPPSRSRASPPPRRGSDQSHGRGSSAPPGSAQRRRDTQGRDEGSGSGSGSLPGGWADDLD